MPLATAWWNLISQRLVMSKIIRIDLFAICDLLALLTAKQQFDFSLKMLKKTALLSQSIL